MYREKVKVIEIKSSGTNGIIDGNAPGAALE